MSYSTTLSITCYSYLFCFSKATVDEALCSLQLLSPFVTFTVLPLNQFHSNLTNISTVKWHFLPFLLMIIAAHLTLESYIYIYFLRGTFYNVELADEQSVCDKPNNQSASRTAIA